MRYLFYITMLLLLQACGSVRRTTTSAIVTTDTLAQRAAKQSADTFYKTSERIVKDTVVKIEQRIVRDTILAKDTELPKTASGQVIPRHFEKSERAITAWVDLHADGSITYGARADSLLLVLQNLEQRYDSVSRANSVNSSDTVRSSTSVQSVQTTTVKKVQGFWSGNWQWLLLAIVAVIVIALYKWFKKQY